MNSMMMESIASTTRYVKISDNFFKRKPKIYVIMIGNIKTFFFRNGKDDDGIDRLNQQHIIYRTVVERFGPQPQPNLWLCGLL